MRKIKIMFVCHGNICRSPMAEFIFKDIIKKEGLEQYFTVTSSATSTEEIYGDIGNPVYPPAKAILAQHGIDCGGKRAVQLTKNDYKSYDLLIAMDKNNVRNILYITGGDPEEKIHKLMEYAGSDADVSDPWYTRNFDKTFNDVLKGCKALLNHLKEL